MSARYLFLLFALAAWPCQAQTWYYCDPLGAYYPHVRTCPAPWRPVDPATVGGRPAPQASAPQAPANRAPAGQASEAGKEYQAGFKAREDWWTWRVTLDGSYRDGVNYWISHRKLAAPGTCDEPIDVTPDPTWTQGCEDAKERVKPIDEKLAAEPAFRRGWASFKPSPEAAKAARKAAAAPPPEAAPEEAAPPAQATPPAPAEPPAPPPKGY